MTPIFLDTVGLIALWDRKDQWHQAATAAFAQFAARRTRLVTSSYVMLECGSQAARRAFRADVVALRKELELNGDLFEPTPAEVDQAWLDYSNNFAGTASVVDHVSFAIMRRLGLTDAFTNDRHFRTAGFTLLF